MRACSLPSDRFLGDWLNVCVEESAPHRGHGESPLDSGSGAILLAIGVGGVMLTGMGFRLKAVFGVGMCGGWEAIIAIVPPAEC